MNSTHLIEVPHQNVSLTVADIDHEVWSFTRPIAITQYWSGAPAPPIRHAEARVVWTNDSLITRFQCRQAEPLVVSNNPQVLQKTLGLWDRDVCEVFIAPNPKQLFRYYEFEAAPTGEWVDLAIEATPEGRDTDWDYHSGMTTAALVASDLVTVMIRVPFSRHIPKPERGDEWRVNLCRCVGIAPNRGYLAWQPTRTPIPNFHVPEAFGRMRFV
jgi:hypothetical protein